MQQIKLRYWIFGFACLALLLPFLFSAKLTIPVQNATFKDWNKNSFWHYPWGKSITHKGIDIFAAEGTPVNAATSGFVLYSNTIGMGGNVVFMVGAKWRIYYYAHLQSSAVHMGQWVKQGTPIGFVGTSGNAAGKPPHLHFEVLTLVPYPWRCDDEPQGWLKMFHLNPDELLWEGMAVTKW